jgi:signal transduction histidine kinase
MNFRRLSLFWKIWLSTSVALAALFAVTGWVVQRHALETTARNLEEEVQAGFQAYASLWRARAEMLRSAASIISSLPNVRAAFGTRDEATMRDAAQEVWARVSEDLRETAFFVVTDPEGNTIASLGEGASAAPRSWPVVPDARARFPEQVLGFFLEDNELVQLVLTPVYVDSGRGPALISVLVTGYAVNHPVAQRLKEATGGSEFVFLSQGRVFASTLNDRASQALGKAVAARAPGARVSDGVYEYIPLRRDLIDVHGKPIGALYILRSFEGARQRVAALRRDVILIWLVAVVAGLGLTHLFARKIVEPVKKLDEAAAEVARENYSYRIGVDSEDELGRLAATFNKMCQSLESARQELIRRERISTIGRLAGSIVHDLRNPLAAIYGGAEMLVDTELAPPQVKRVAGSVYKASRRIQELLQDLVNVTRGKSGRAEICGLREVIADAADQVRPVAERQAVSLAIDLPDELELPLERGRMERVFLNLFSNALEAMPDGGSIMVSVSRNGETALVEVRDSGPGISPQIRDQLFQPFVTFGKKNGLGLGLALSRQTVLDQGGDLWVESEPGRGARFLIRLPLVRNAAVEALEKRPG